MNRLALASIVATAALALVALAGPSDDRPRGGGGGGGYVADQAGGTAFNDSVDGTVDYSDPLCGEAATCMDPTTDGNLVISNAAGTESITIDVGRTIDSLEYFDTFETDGTNGVGICFAPPNTEGGCLGRQKFSSLSSLASMDSAGNPGKISAAVFEGGATYGTANSNVDIQLSGESTYPQVSGDGDMQIWYSDDNNPKGTDGVGLARVCSAYTGGACTVSGVPNDTLKVIRDWGAVTTNYGYLLAVPIVADYGAKPTCDSTIRGAVHNDQGGAGVADLVEVCTKGDDDVYRWHGLSAKDGGNAYVSTKATAISTTGTGTPAACDKITGGTGGPIAWTGVNLNGFTLTSGNGELDVVAGKGGWYRVDYSVSFGTTTGGGSVLWEFNVATNDNEGSPVETVHAQCASERSSTAATNPTGNTGGTCIIEIPGDSGNLDSVYLCVRDLTNATGVGIDVDKASIVLTRYE
jgi:hypothetical protein